MGKSVDDYLQELLLLVRENVRVDGPPWMTSKQTLSGRLELQLSMVDRLLPLLKANGEINYLADHEGLVWIVRLR